MKRTCVSCCSPDVEKGRAVDGRRAYRCRNCGHTWTEGMQGRVKRWNSQMIARGIGYQFGNRA